MFHFAPPDCEGSGVKILRPGCVRSFQFLMCFGFPGRTANTTAPDCTTDSSVSLFQSCVINPAFSTNPTSGASDDAKMSALNPATMFSACVVLPPKDIWKMSFWPSCASAQSDAKVDVSFP